MTTYIASINDNIHNFKKIKIQTSSSASVFCTCFGRTLDQKTRGRVPWLARNESEGGGRGVMRQTIQLTEQGPNN